MYMSINSLMVLQSHDSSQLFVSLCLIFVCTVVYVVYFNHTEKKTHAVWSSGQNGRVDRRQENFLSPVMRSLSSSV